MISHPYAPIPSANGLGAGFGYLNNFSQGIWSTRERDFQAYVYYNDLWLYDFVLAGDLSQVVDRDAPSPPHARPHRRRLMYSLGRFMI